MSDAMRDDGGSDGLGGYLRELARTPLLSRDQEVALARLARAGDDDARQRMVLHNLRFVVRLARELRPPRMGLLDVIAEGNVGLARAAASFDPDKGVRFTTYAAYWIKEKIRCFLAQQGGAVALPEKKLRQVRQLAATRRRLAAARQEPPTDGEVAAAVGISTAEARRLHGAAHQATTLDAVAELSQCQGPGGPRDGKEVRELDHEHTERELQGDVEQLLGHLPARERQCIRLYFGLAGDPPRTFREIGGLLSLGKEGTRQVFQRGLRRLRTMPATEHLRVCWA